MLSLTGWCCTVSPCIARTFLSGLFPSNAHAPNALAYKQVIAMQTPVQPAPYGNNRETSSRTRTNVATTAAAAIERRIVEGSLNSVRMYLQFLLQSMAGEKRATALATKIELARISAGHGVGRINPLA